MATDSADKTTGRRKRATDEKTGREIIRRVSRSDRPEVIEHLAREIEKRGLSAAVGRKEEKQKMEPVR